MALAAVMTSALLVPTAAHADRPTEVAGTQTSTATGPSAAPVAETTVQPPAVVPTPQQWAPAADGDPMLQFDRRVRILVTDRELRPVADLLAADLTEVSGLRPIVLPTRHPRPRAGDIVLSEDTAGEVGAEGYELAIDNHVQLTAATHDGAVYGTRTLLQLLTAGGEARDTLPRGTIVDAPGYAERGVMLDVARRFASVDFVKQYIRQMSWLKMNLLHLHLSDDEAFRLTSDIPGLTSEQHYTNAEIADLVAYADSYGVTILPEIDVPSHSTRILESRPDLGHECEALDDTRLGLLDLSNPDTLPFVTSMIDEYLPLFEGQIHFGTDEYPNAATKDPEENRELLASCPELAEAAAARGYDDPGDLYRDFIDDVTRHIESEGGTAWIWTWFEYVGSKPLETSPVLDDWKGTSVEEYSAAGYQIVNSDGGYTYIMPGRRVLNKEWLYDTWGPWLWSPLAADLRLEPDDENLLGLKVNLWNPPRWTPSIPEAAISAELAPFLPLYAEKGWAGPGYPTYEEFEAAVEEVGYAPGFGLGALATYRFEDTALSTPGENSRGVGRDGTIEGAELTEGRHGTGLAFAGGADRMVIGAPDVDGPWSLGLWVRRDAADGPRAVLFDSPDASIRLEQQGPGERVGLTSYTGHGRHHHSFDYTAPEGEWVHLGFVSDQAGTSLYADGELVDQVDAQIALPMQYLGSTRDAFAGVVDDVKVFGSALDADGMRSLADGLAAHYTFDSGEDVTVPDVSGLGNDAGAEHVARVAGLTGGGLEFDGSDDMVYTGMPDGIADQWTGTAWLRRTDSHTVETLFSSSVTGYSIRVAQYRTGQVGLTHTGDPARSDRPPVTDRWDQSFDYSLPADGTWRHLAFVGDESGTTLYVDGVARDHTSRQIELPTQFVGVYDRGSASLSGTVDEVRFYDRALTGQEVAELATAGS